MYLQDVMLSPYSPTKGSNLDVLDPNAVRQNFQTIQNESLNAETKVNGSLADMNTRIAELSGRLATLEGFFKFAVEQRPETMQAYLTMLKAKGVLGV